MRLGSRYERGHEGSPVATGHGPNAASRRHATAQNCMQPTQHSAEQHGPLSLSWIQPLLCLPSWCCLPAGSAVAPLLPATVHVLHHNTDNVPLLMDADAVAAIHSANSMHGSQRGANQTAVAVVQSGCLPATVREGQRVHGGRQHSSGDHLKHTNTLSILGAAAATK